MTVMLTALRGIDPGDHACMIDPAALRPMMMPAASLAWPEHRRRCGARCARTGDPAPARRTDVGRAPETAAVRPRASSARGGASSCSNNSNIGCGDKDGEGGAGTAATGASTATAAARKC